MLVTLSKRDWMYKTGDYLQKDWGEQPNAVLYFYIKQI